MANHTLFAFVTFSKINSFAYISSKLIQHLYNMKDSPKNNILISETIRQKTITIPEYCDAYIYQYYQPKIIQ